MECDEPDPACLNTDACRCLYSARSYRSSTTVGRTRSEAGNSVAGDAHLPKGDLAVYGPPRPAAKHGSYGRVPSYLRERQLELAEAHARQQAYPVHCKNAKWLEFQIHVQQGWAVSTSDRMLLHTAMQVCRQCAPQTKPHSVHDRSCSAVSACRATTARMAAGATHACVPLSLPLGPAATAKQLSAQHSCPFHTDELLPAITSCN